ncbi:hypothetical protein GGI22_006508 [Coemansia erecta]|nr:hypothetical protein GGI22_006508 [Coemansia erecta]
METRYYSAELELWVDTTEPLTESECQYMQRWLDDPDSHNDDGAASSDGEGTTKKVAKLSTESIPIDEGMVQLQEHLSEVVDAVVFVFDPAYPDSFSDILPWARYGRLYGPGVLLCLAAAGPIGEDTQTPEPLLSSGEVGVSDSSRDKWVAWCISNGWEWVDLTDPDPDSDYTVERVREALASNEWTNMSMKRHARRNAVGPPKPSVQADHDESDKAQTSSDSDTVRKSCENETTRPQGEKEQEEWDLFESIARSVDPGRVEALRRLLFATGGTEQASLDENQHETNDAAAADISPLLDRLRRMREEISHLDKDQARAKAAELAMAFSENI